jgi:serine protease inhibitor
MRTCPMMRMKDSLMYAQSDGVQAVDLAYGDGAFSMLILLPQAGKTVDALIQGLTPGKWDGWVNDLKKTEVSLTVPKFKTLYDKELSVPLTDMGMGVAFTPAADFTGIHRAGGLYIDRVLHKAFVEVNEEGTEAAAATVVVIIEKSPIGSEEVFMTVDRPFVFAIRERQSGALLFMGKIENPDSNAEGSG